MHIHIFHSTSSMDLLLVTTLKKHLAMFERSGVLTVDLVPITDDHSISPTLEAADLIGLALSSDFMSDEVGWTTFTRALQRHRQGEARTVMVLLRSVLDSEVKGIARFPHDGSIAGNAIHECEECGHCLRGDSLETIMAEGAAFLFKHAKEVAKLKIWT